MPHFWKTATVVCSKENVGVGLSRYRFGSDQGVPQQWEPGCFCIRHDYYCPGAAGLNVGDKHPYHREGGKQKPKQGFPESGILLTSCVNTSIPDMPSLWYLE